MSGNNDKPMFAGLSESARRPQDTNEFHLRGISVEIEPCSAGFDENSQFVDMGGVTVDRFDCRLLLDPLDLRVVLKANQEDGWCEEENGDLDEIRYGDLYDDGPRSVSNQGVDGGGEYGAVAFSYDAPSTNIGTSSLISPPPPPYARAIVEQSLRDSIPPPSIGPVSLRQLAVMRLVAKYTAGLERDGTLLEDDGVFCRFEFADSGHVHYMIFRDMVKRFKAVAGSHESVREEEGKPESIAMLLEYQDDDDDDDFIPMQEKLSMKAIVCMMYNISLKRDAEAFLMRVKGMHGEGFLFHGTPEKRFRSFIQDLEDCIKEKRDCDDGKTKTRDDDDDDGGNKRTQEEEEDPFALGDSDAQAPIDDSILAERRRKAQMMLKKRKHDHEEKTRLLRKRTVENDRLQREKTVSAIQQHRKMFQDSDEED